MWPRRTRVVYPLQCRLGVYVVIPIRRLLPAYAEPESADRLGFRFWCCSGMRLLAWVIGWINVSYREWPLTVNLNDGRSACPTVVVHFGRCFAESPRR
jgi:hypothetical protein